MFDNNVFIEGSCHNFSEEKCVKGFSLATNITYYRAIPLSMVNDIRVYVDAKECPRTAIRCSVDKKDWFTLDEMKTVTTYKWEYDEPLYIRVLKDGGLQPGTHQVKLTVITRTAYIPVPIEGSTERTVEIKA